MKNTKKIYSNIIYSGSLFGLFNSAKLAALAQSVNNQKAATLHMVHAIERVANNSETNSRHIEYLELMSQQIAKEVSKNRIGIEVAFIMLNINR